MTNANLGQSGTRRRAPRTVAFAPGAARARKTDTAPSITVPEVLTAAPQELTDVLAQEAPADLGGGHYLRVETAIAFDGVALVLGWVSQGVPLKIPGLLGKRSVRRPDVQVDPARPAIGFLVALAVPADAEQAVFVIDGGAMHYRVPVRFEPHPDAALQQLAALAALLPPLLPHVVASQTMGRHLRMCCPELDPAQREHIDGHVDTVLDFQGFGAISYGWAITSGNYEFWLASACGKWRALGDAIRYNRPDVDASFSKNFGVRTAEAGFFCALPGALAAGKDVALVAAGADGMFVVHRSVAASGPRDPLAYARWAFSLPTPFSRFNDRLERHDGPLLAHLIQRRHDQAAQRCESWDVGMPPTAPQVSVIIPLYGSLRFVEHQLLAFSADDQFRTGQVEVLYVLDDPSLVEEMRRQAPLLHKLYGVPFRVVWGGYNRGYAGANNLGLRVAQGSTVILVNSDVFPLEAGWCGAMAGTLARDPTISAVGARLDYPDGSIQHIGMAFEWSSELSVWLNRHPGRGIEPPSTADAVIDVPAATGACLAVRRNDLEAIGGLDEQYLIGDFEDSDLCLRLAGTERRIVVLATTRLVHLERQSFHLIGDSGFRQCVTLYNAWRHTRLWNEQLQRLDQEATQ